MYKAAWRHSISLLGKYGLTENYFVFKASVCEETTDLKNTNPHQQYKKASTVQGRKEEQTEMAMH